MNVDAIFDVFTDASTYVHLRDEINKKQSQIRNVTSKKCGNCEHWMKASCIPEQKHKQFKSCGSFGCKDFELCAFSKAAASNFVAELSDIKSKILNKS